MKRMLCICLALLLIACPALAEAGDSVGALIDQMDACLAICEQCYLPCMAAYQWMEDFHARQDYASLVNLRIASDRAQLDICFLEEPELNLTDGQLMDLMGMGVETDALEAWIRMTGGYIQGSFMNMVNLETVTDSMLISGSGMDGIYASTQAMRACMDLEMQYVCTLLNYLLLPVADDPRVQQFWDSIPQRYPTLGSVWMDWETDGAVLEERAVLAMHDYANLSGQAAGLVGADRYSADQTIASMGQQDLEALRADVLRVDGMPAMLPLPVDWLDPVDSVILADGESAGALPDAITIRQSDVPMEAFTGYVQQLTDAGAVLCETAGSDAEGWTYVLRCDDQQLVLRRESDGTASVTYDPEFISLEWPIYLDCLQ